jgi:hypothetical protein
LESLVVVIDEFKIKDFIDIPKADLLIELYFSSACFLNVLGVLNFNRWSIVTKTSISLGQLKVVITSQTLGRFPAEASLAVFMTIVTEVSNLDRVLCLSTINADIGIFSEDELVFTFDTVV